MTKSRLLLLDADVVIHLFELSLWDSIVDRYDVHLSRTIVQEEAFYYKDGADEEAAIKLHEYESEKKIRVFDIAASEAAALRNKFGEGYFERMDPGETETLCRLLGSSGGYRLCAIDKIVFRVLGNLGRSEDAISLEELLIEAGLARTRLPRYMTKQYRKEWSSKGFADGQRNIGIKDKNDDLLR